MQQIVDSTSSPGFLVLPLVQTPSEDVGDVIVVFLGQHLQVEGGDDPVGAGQHGLRDEVRGEGGR